VHLPGRDANAAEASAETENAGTPIPDRAYFTPDVCDSPLNTHHPGGDADKGEEALPALVPDEEEAEAIADGEPEDEDAAEAEEDWVKSTGPLPNQARVEAQQLAAYLDQEVEKIARKYKKSTRDILLAAGLSIRSARTRSPNNMYKIWYAHHHPRDKSKGMLHEITFHVSLM
jgi:hypothetical protein